MPFASNGDLKIYYEEVGKGDPVVWIQGLGASNTAWNVQKFYFSRCFRCIFIDNRDVGQSSRANADYTTKDMAEDVLCVLESADIDSAHIIGLSMGGAIAQELALSSPKKVKSLVLVSTFATPDARIRAVNAAWGELYGKVNRELFYKQVEPWLFSASYLEKPSNIRAFRRYIQHEPNPQETDAYQRQVRAVLSHNTTDRLEKISNPTLIIAGEQDILVSPLHSKLLAELIPNAELEIIPGAAHSVNIENQKEFNNRVRSFLESYLEA